MFHAGMPSGLRAVHIMLFCDYDFYHICSGEKENIFD